MPPVVVLLSLLLGTLEVGAAPLDKEEYPGEMVTRCIVEVLSNALAKPNAPPIDPECKEILKSTRLGRNEKQGEIPQFETRNLKEMTLTDKHLRETSEETKQEAPEDNISQEQDEKKRHHEQSESHEKEEEGRDKKNHIEENEEDTGHSKERDFIENEGENKDHKDHYENEEITKKDKGNLESRHDIFDKKVHTSDKSVEEFSEEGDEEPRNFEEIMKRHHGHINWKENLKRPEEHQTSHSYEVSEESKEGEDEEKRSHKPNHDFGQRLLGYEEKRSHEAEQKKHIDLHEEQPYSRAQKRYYGLNSFEDDMKKSHYDKRTHHENQSSGELKEKRHFHRGSEEEKENSNQSDESYENEPNRQHFEEVEEKRLHEQRKRWPNGRNPTARYNYEQSNEDSNESKDDIDKHYFNDRGDKENLFAKIRHQNEGESPYKHDVKEDKRHYVGEEMVDEMKRFYPGYSEEKEKRHNNEELRNHHFGGSKEDADESNYIDNEKFKRHSEEEGRPVNKYGLADNQLKWKNKYFDNDDSQILDSEEEIKRNMQSKHIFPEYSDYDWWGKKQLLEDMSHGYGEERTSPKINKFEEKRQYDRMDELAQLLNYKKKSVEIPDFYESEEIRKRNFNERGSLGRRPLTEEEEKELENLAIMDMELQKIAEKLSHKRQG
ncbi:secretogranin-1 [Spea bombifrons]|uniref:secretogranin-1 n=1 Tax=Spea bombifrons TaxID=233779 RepID=UPI0023496862|nr:secretogranin-1 [Spea bombifrons]